MDYLYLMNELDQKVKEVLKNCGEDDPKAKEIDTEVEMVMHFLNLSKKEALDLISWAEFANYGNEFTIKLNDIRRTCRHYIA